MFPAISLAFFLMFVWGGILSVSHNLIFREPQYKIRFLEGVKPAAALVAVQLAMSIVIALLIAFVPETEEFAGVLGILYYVVLFVIGVLIIQRMMGGLFLNHAALIMVIALAIRWLLSFLIALVFLRLTRPA